MKILLSNSCSYYARNRGNPSLTIFFKNEEVSESDILLSCLYASKPWYHVNSQ